MTSILYEFAHQHFHLMILNHFGLDRSFMFRAVLLGFGDCLKLPAFHWSGPACNVMIPWVTEVTLDMAPGIPLLLLTSPACVPHCGDAFSCAAFCRLCCCCLTILSFQPEVRRRHLADAGIDGWSRRGKEIQEEEVNLLSYSSFIDELATTFCFPFHLSHVAMNLLFIV